jgi:hypothetical protein
MEAYCMSVAETDSSWSKKGATLSDKSAREEFELTQEEIVQAIKDGKLQYRHNNMYGNPYLKLLRSEVEALVNEKYGKSYLKMRKIKRELVQISSESKRLKAQMVSLEQRKAQLQATLDEMEVT